MSAQQPLLSLKSISKQYPGCLANDNVSLAIEHGEIHALLGENGAGKSTLVKIIYGLLKPSEGQLYWKGDNITIDSPSAARQLGIGMVFQHFSLFEAMSVAENISLGLDQHIAHHQLNQKIIEVSESYGLPLEPEREVHTLSVGERQRIEIVRCLLQSPKLLIMDEPTSVLTPQEVEQLFKTLRKLKQEGCAILYISHKLDEIKKLCEAATILRDGKVVAQCDPREQTAQSLAKLMIGETPQVVAKADAISGEAIFTVKQLSKKSAETFGTDLEAISLSIKPGEILGVAGVAGNGQTELLSSLSGEQLSQPGTLFIKGEDCSQENSVNRRQRGMAFVPEDRLGHGAVPSMSLTENTILSGFKKQRLIKALGIDFSSAKSITEKIRDDFNVKSTGSNDPAQSLSGGNLQKFIVGREINQDPEILILGQPTWGVDAGSAVVIHQAIIKLAQQGTAILIVSQDLDELLLLSHRIAVISEGRLSEFKAVQQVSAESLGLLMGGTHLDEEHQREEFGHA